MPAPTHLCGGGGEGLGGAVAALAASLGQGLQQGWVGGGGEVMAHA